MSGSGQLRDCLWPKADLEYAPFSLIWTAGIGKSGHSYSRSQNRRTERSLYRRQHHLRRLHSGTADDDPVDLTWQLAPSTRVLLKWINEDGDKTPLISRFPEPAKAIAPGSGRAVSA